MPLIYTFNLAGYRPSALPAGERGRYTLGGFTDATFSALAVLEVGGEADWPFEEPSSGWRQNTHPDRGAPGRAIRALPPAELPDQGRSSTSPNMGVR